MSWKAKMSRGKLTPSELAHRWVRNWMRVGLEARPEKQRELKALLAQRIVNNEPMYYGFAGEIDLHEALSLLNKKFPEA